MIDFEKYYYTEEDYYDRFFDSLIVYDLEKQEAKFVFKIYSKEKDMINTAGRFDSMIVGVLSDNGVDEIITKNVNQFKKIEGLRVISYWGFWDDNFC